MSHPVQEWVTQDTHHINDLLNDALQRWVDVCDIDLEDTSFHFGGEDFSRSHLRKIAEAISDARDLDPSGLTSWMMLRGVWGAYLKKFTFSAYQLIMERGVVEELVTKMKALRELLEDEYVVALIEAFEDKIRGAATSFGVDDTKALEGLLADKWTLAYVRRDALLALDTLEEHQFWQGDSETQRLGYNSSIFEFWNMNSMLRAMRGQGKPGTTICLVRDPVALWSYFVFAVVNGPNLTILTDREDRAHPDQKYMSRSRSQGRRFAARATRFWFPYQLVEVEVTADQKDLYAKARTALVPVNAEAVKLATLADLDAEQVVWASLMFDLISTKYGEQAEQNKTEELSYTGEMIVDPNTLVGESGALVLQGHYKPLELEPLTTKTVNSEEATKQYHSKYSDRIDSTGFNQWMIDRYGGQVPNDMVNLVGERAAHVLLTDQATEVTIEKDWRTRVEEPVFDLKIGDVDLRLKIAPSRAGLGFMEATDFGSKEDLVRDREWYGRKNSMIVIQRLAVAEYEREKDNVLAWFFERIKARKQWFIEAAATGKLVLPDHKFLKRGVPFQNDERIEQNNALAQWVSPRWDGESRGYWEYRSLQVHIGATFSTDWVIDERCPVTSKKATVHTQIRPTCPEALAFLCGCGVDELHWALQHWYTRSPYSGNSILDRVDSADWVLENPWMKDLTFAVGVSMSKNGVHKTRKALGLPRQTWEADDDS